MKRGRIVENRVLAATLLAAVGVLTMGGLMRGAASGAAAEGLPVATAAGFVAVEPAMAMRAAFTWTGNDNASDLWNDPDNWSGFGGACLYPCTSMDDATIGLCGFYVVFDASRTIDELNITVNEGTCGGRFDLANANDNFNLTCDSLVISGYNEGGDTPLGITMNNGAGIETN